MPMLKLYRLTPKDHNGYSYGYYDGFLIAANSIPEALETMYQRVSPAKDVIPFYLRSSNIKIEQIGTVELEKGVHPLLNVDFYSGD